MIANLSKEAEEIIAFIQKSKDGYWYTDIKNHFCSKKGKWGWSNGKFINHWKKTEPFREKKLFENYKRLRWVIEETQKKEARKVLLMRDIREQELDTVEISKEEIEAALIKLEELREWQYLKKASFWTFLKLNKKEAKFFWDVERRRNARNLQRYIEFHLLTPKKQEVSPEIPKWSYVDLLKVLLAAREFSSRVLKEGQSFEIVLSYDDVGRVTEKTELKKEVFVEWLRIFKKESIDPDTLSYVVGEKDRDQRTFENIEKKMQFLEKNTKFQKLLGEFLTKQNKILKTQTQLVEGYFKQEAPDIYRKFKVVQDQRVNEK